MALPPPVAVVLTTYNRAKQIGRTIESVLAQSMGDFEFLIADDCSGDGTEEVCRAYESRDRRIHYVRNPRNVSMPANLNGGIRRTRAPLIANLHDGDVYRPDLLERWKRALEEDPGIAFVFNGWENLDAEGRVTGRFDAGFAPRVERGELVQFMLGPFRPGGPRTPRPPEAGVRTVRQRALYWFLGRFGCPVWGTAMGRRSRYEELGLFDPRYGLISDVAHWLRLNARYPAAYIREPLFALAPTGADRPHAKVNWDLERKLFAILDEAISLSSGLGGPDPGALRAGLRRARVKRWAFLMAWSAAKGNGTGVRQGLEMFRDDDARMLRTIARIAAAFTRPSGT